MEWDWLPNGKIFYFDGFNLYVKVMLDLNIIFNYCDGLLCMTMHVKKLGERFVVGMTILHFICYYFL
jgi:hypothetical protein